MNTKDEANAQSYFSQRLKTYSRRIIEQFIDNTRKELPSAKFLDEVTLENGLNQFLNILAKILEVEQKEEWQGLYRDNVINSRIHGKTRAEIPSYTLDQVITEYRYLRSIILEVLGEERNIPPEQLDKILFSIDNGITQAATEFAVVRGFADARITEEFTAKNMALVNEGSQRDQFVLTLSHDMRNPLSIARACGEMIQKNPANLESVQKLSNKIIESIDRANNMIQDLLDSNKIRAGAKLTINKSQIDLAKIVNAIIEDFTKVYGDRLQVACPTPVKIKVDSAGIRRAIENLLTNAIKYGGTQTPVRTNVIEFENEVQIKVHNEGNPIPSEDQVTLFDYFHRSKSGVQSGQQGWGIGLTLVKGIAEAHNGHVLVESSEKAGTTFSIVLPRS